LGWILRGLVVLAVVVLLIMTLASSLSVFLDQRSQIADLNQQIADEQAAISDLNDRLARWNDPAYVKAQAREQLGWVMPGEIGYRVVDADGNLIGAVEPIGVKEADPAPTIWYEALAASLLATDQPAPVEPEATTPVEVITVDDQGPQ
jgi:cell division protein FtsB